MTTLSVTTAAGVFAQLEKARLVGKLRAARERKRATGVKVEGRKSIAEWATPERPHLGAELVAEARRLRRKRPKGGQRSYRQIASELFQAGYTNSNGRAFSPSSIKAMVEV